MPYSSASDVPSYVPTEKKKQWLAVFNKRYEDEIKAGKSKKDAEASAFKLANGVVKKECVEHGSELKEIQEGVFVCDQCSSSVLVEEVIPFQT